MDREAMKGLVEKFLGEHPDDGDGTLAALEALAGENPGLMDYINSEGEAEGQPESVAEEAGAAKEAPEPVDGDTAESLVTEVLKEMPENERDALLGRLGYEKKAAAAGPPRGHEEMGKGNALARLLASLG